MQIQNYFMEHTVSSDFAGQEIEFLPHSAMAALTTTANIEAVVNQDRDLNTIHFPSHSRTYLSNRIATEAKRMFIVTVSERLGMNFLRVLLRENRSTDEHLPLQYGFRIRDEKNVFWDGNDVERFLDAQQMVCAPTFKRGRFDQKAAFRAALPIVEATRIGGSTGEDIWRVRFHGEHLDGWAGDQDLDWRWFTVKMFRDWEEARKDKRWTKKVFGFTCEEIYHLVGDP